MTCLLEHFPFVPMVLHAAVGWLFGHGYAKEYARYFQAVLKQFHNHAQKVARLLRIKYYDKRRMLRLHAVPMARKNILLCGKCRSLPACESQATAVSFRHILPQTGA